MKILKNIKIQKTIPLHPTSERFIHEDFFKGNEGHKYKLVDKLWDKINGVCIIHMYPEEDTIDLKTGELNGYNSSLFFRTIIYNVDKLEMYDYGLKDGINVNMPCKVQYFKDMSTMITIYGGCKIGRGQDFTVYPL